MENNPENQQDDVNAIVSKDNEDYINDLDAVDNPDVNQHSYKTDQQQVNKGTKNAAMPPTNSTVLAEL